MASYNRIIMMGNLTRDPELKALPSGMSVVEFGLATNKRYKTKDGQDKEDVCFVECKCFGKRAEVINQWMTKGKPIMLEGELGFDTWDSPTGEKRSKHYVNISSFTFVGGAGDKPVTNSTPAAVPVEDMPF